MDLVTARLTLRLPAPEDFTEACWMWADPRVTRFIGGRPFTAEEVWNRLLRYRGHWALFGYGYWTVREHGGTYVGEVGLAHWKRDLAPELAGTPEAGWALSPAVAGRGYATEAVRAALEWRSAHVPGALTVCIISPENVPSRKVAEKCGFGEEKRAFYHGEPTLLLRHSSAAPGSDRAG